MLQIDANMKRMHDYLWFNKNNSCSLVIDAQDLGLCYFKKEVFERVNTAKHINRPR